ncbi:deoxyribose-phosphate aldolase [Pasteuria penetrans]|uniref:deoxyribose-phosphate aldolase n=1 Tax=Pasteuria penetrans TaxID=86005 RepID=UPI001FE74F80|nr:deoxyribose-phosphate aldolase [Pasteuria penetrans]
MALLHGQQPSLGARLDHTLLAPAATRSDIVALCDAARRHQFASVCILPTWVRCASEVLRGSGVAVGTVIGFPLGSTSTTAKVAEARTAVHDGASELDMVLNLGAFKSGEYQQVVDDIHAVVGVAKGCLVKVILEVGYLDATELNRACQLAVQGGAHFVKTATGFGPRGASVGAIRAMVDAVGDKVAVKASGGIRDSKFAYELLMAGADRLGTSVGENIMREGVG